MKQSNQILLIFLLISFFSQASTVKFYVSTKGSDANSGSINAPFATLERARDKVRESQETSKKNSNYEVILRGGIYNLSQSFVLGAEDSGKGNSTISYQSMKGEVAQLSGAIGVKPSLFETLNVTDPNYSRICDKVKEKILVLDLLQYKIEDFGSMRRKGFRFKHEIVPMELFVNNKNQQLARWPNEGYEKIVAPIDSVSFVYATNRPVNWMKERDPWALGYWRNGWSETYVPIKNIDTLQHTITLKYKPDHEIKPFRTWCVINVLEELDIPGEYYIDRDHGRLYFYPSDLRAFKNADVSLSFLGENKKAIVHLDNVKNVHFKNLIIEKTRYAAISATACNNIVIDNCVLRNTGSTALLISGNNITVLNSEIYDSGGGGIIASGGHRPSLTPGNILIENCHIHSFGVWNRTYNPGVDIRGVGNTIRNCEISNAPHAAIIFYGNNHIIEKNKIHNVCSETDDSGAIYTSRDWALHGNVIRFNYIFDIQSDHEKSPIQTYDNGVHAIYLDDCASGIHVYGNIFNNISGRAIMSGGGRDIKIHSNIIMNSASAHFSDRRGLVRIKHDDGKNLDVINSWDLKRKIEQLNYTKPPFSTAFPTLASIMDEGFEKAKEPMGCEIIANIGFNNKRWLEHNCNGKCGAFDFYTMKDNIENEDPQFIDNNDLLKGLKKTSPVNKINGFIQIPFKSIGIQNAKK